MEYFKNQPTENANSAIKMLDTLAVIRTRRNENSRRGGQDFTSSFLGMYLTLIELPGIEYATR
jgi:hypothetical protein